MTRRTRRKRRDLGASFEQEAWECHRAISRRVSADPWHVSVLDWGSHDNVNAVNAMMQSFVERIVNLMDGQP